MWYHPARFLAGLVVLAAAFGGAALDAAAQTQFRPSVSPWEGFYLGVHGGYGWGDIDVVEDPANAPPYVGAGNAWGFDADGAIGGAHLGLNWESYGLVMGIEAEFGYMAIEGDAPDPASLGLDTIAAQGDGYYGDATIRIAFAPGNMLYHMEGGVAFADLGWSVEDDCSTALPCGPETVSAVSDGTETGWTAGVGIAYAFWQHASLRLDYAYMDFGTVRMTGTDAGNSYSWEQDVRLHTVTAGLTFMF
jgi:outer membrane immunogenic protein